MTPRLLEYCRTHQQWLVDAIKEFAAIESPSDDKVALDRCGEWLAGRLREVGAAVTEVPQETAGNHLVARFGTGNKRVLLLGHFDTVWPIGQLDRMPIREQDGRLYGPGVLDMKAGLSMAVLATRAVLELAPPRDTQVTLLCTTDEEVGSDTSRELIEVEARASDAVLVFEPALANGGLKTARKGIGQYELSAHGVSAHAGVDPRKGVNAIRELALQVLALDQLRDLDRGISINVGVITGGTRSNVVPDLATAQVDVRVQTLADAGEIDRTLRELKAVTPGAKLDVTGGFNRPPMERSAGVVRLFELATASAAELGVTLLEGATGGGSDGNFTAALGVPTLDGLGALGDGAHALHEYIELASLPVRTAIVAGLLYRLTNGSEK